MEVLEVTQAVAIRRSQTKASDPRQHSDNHNHNHSRLGRIPIHQIFQDLDLSLAHIISQTGGSAKPQRL